jgi:hypothetical protein
MTVDDQDGRVTLAVRGPGVTTATYHFPDLQALMEFAQRQEQQLQDDGFQLQAIAERRTGRERRGAMRPDATDRRH